MQWQGWTVYSKTSPGIMTCILNGNLHGQRVDRSNRFCLEHVLSLYLLHDTHFVNLIYVCQNLSFACAFICSLLEISFSCSPCFLFQWTISFINLITIYYSKYVQRFIYINKQVKSNSKFKNLTLYTLYIFLDLKPLDKLEKAWGNFLVW